MRYTLMIICAVSYLLIGVPMQIEEVGHELDFLVKKLRIMKLRRTKSCI